jgi:hypothetical protein
MTLPADRSSASDALTPDEALEILKLPESEIPAPVPTRRFAGLEAPIRDPSMTFLDVRAARLSRAWARSTAACSSGATC